MQKFYGICRTRRLLQSLSSQSPREYVRTRCFSTAASLRSRRTGDVADTRPARRTALSVDSHSFDWTNKGYPA